jgi:hypothetical protein
MDAQKLYKFDPMLGPYEEYPVGSLEWAERISQRLQVNTRAMSRNSVRHVRAVLRDIFSATKPPWEVWPKLSPIGTPDDYCRVVTGHSWSLLLQIVQELSEDEEPDLTFNGYVMRTELAKAQAEHRKQGVRTDLLPYEIRKSADHGADGGTSASYLLRRLAKDEAFAAILAAYERGEFKSVRAAARAAGLIKDQTPLQIILKQLPKLLSVDERATVRRALDEMETCDA